MKRAIPGIIFIVSLVAVMLSLSTVSYAAGPQFLFDFDSLPTNASAVDHGIVSIGGDEGVRVEFEATINSDVSLAKETGNSRVATGWGKSLKIVSGKWKLGPTWQNMYLNIPESKQNWSAYKQFGFYMNNQLCNAQNMCGLIFMFEDKDKELWGWKVPVEKSWSYLMIDKEEKKTLNWADSDWQGLGHTDWYGNYITMKLDPSFFEKKSGPEGSNGVFDLDKIQRVLVQMDLGPAGVREGDILYFDDFFLAKTAVVAGNKYLVDGVDIAARNEGKPQPSESSKQTDKSSKTTASKAPGAVSGSDESADVSSELSSAPAQSADGEGESSAAAQSQPGDKTVAPGESGNTVLIIIIAAVIVLAAGAAVFFIIKNRKKSA